MRTHSHDRTIAILADISAPPTSSISLRGATVSTLSQGEFRNRPKDPPPYDAVFATSPHYLDDTSTDYIKRGGHLWLFLSPGWVKPAHNTVALNPGRSYPFSEWSLAPDRSIFGLERMPQEFEVTAPLTVLAPPPTAAVIASVNIAMHVQPIITQEHIGDGLLSLVGLPLEVVTYRNPELCRLIEVLLHRGRQTKSSRNPLGVGIVGYGPNGGMGLFHGTAVQNTPGLTLVSALDHDPRRLEQAHRDFANLQGFDSIDSMARDSQTEIAIVATPPVSHFDIAMQLLDAGKHVVVEKPLCLTVDQADKLVKQARSVDKVLTVHQNRRWDQDFRTIKRIIDDGTIGEVFNIETFVGGFEHPCHAWHSDEGVSGGIGYDWGAHHIDWIHQLYGASPTQVWAFGHKRRWFGVTNLDQIRIHLRFDGGREATFFQSEITGWRKPKFYIQGTLGTIVGNYRVLEVEQIDPTNGYTHEIHHHAEAPAKLELAIYDGTHGIDRRSPPLLPTDRFGFHRDLGDHLLVGTPLAVQPEEIRDVVAVLELSHDSAHHGTIRDLT
ncbi:MAG: Gfo/Idh/MocA family protein [Ferrimicrobium sp.]